MLWWYAFDSKIGFLSQPQHLWDTLEVVLSRGDNIEEAQFVERLGATLATGQSEKSMKHISNVIMPKIQYEESLMNDFMGMTYVRMYETFPKRQRCVSEW